MTRDDSTDGTADDQPRLSRRQALQGIGIGGASVLGGGDLTEVARQVAADETTPGGEGSAGTAKSPGNYVWERKHETYVDTEGYEDLVRRAIGARNAYTAPAAREEYGIEKLSTSHRLRYLGATWDPFFSVGCDRNGDSPHDGSWRHTFMLSTHGVCIKELPSDDAPGLGEPTTGPGPDCAGLEGESNIRPGRDIAGHEFSIEPAAEDPELGCVGWNRIADRDTYAFLDYEAFERSLNRDAGQWTSPSSLSEDEFLNFDSAFLSATLTAWGSVLGSLFAGGGLATTGLGLLLTLLNTKPPEEQIYEGLSDGIDYGGIPKTAGGHHVLFGVNVAPYTSYTLDIESSIAVAPLDVSVAQGSETAGNIPRAAMDEAGGFSDGYRSAPSWTVTLDCLPAPDDATATGRPRAAASTGSGGGGRDCVDLDVEPIPEREATAQITIDPDRQVPPGTEVTFGTDFFEGTISLTGDPDREFRWTFDDGDTERGETVTRQFDSPGSYGVKLEIDYTGSEPYCGPETDPPSSTDTSDIRYRDVDQSASGAAVLTVSDDATVAERDYESLTRLDPKYSVAPGRPYVIRLDLPVEERAALPSIEERSDGEWVPEATVTDPNRSELLYRPSTDFLRVNMHGREATDVQVYSAPQVWPAATAAGEQCMDPKTGEPVPAVGEGATPVLGGPCGTWKVYQVEPGEQYTVETFVDGCDDCRLYDAAYEVQEPAPEAPENPSDVGRGPWRTVATETDPKGKSFAGDRHVRTVTPSSSRLRVRTYDGNDGIGCYVEVFGPLPRSRSE